MTKGREKTWRRGYGLCAGEKWANLYVAQTCMAKNIKVVGEPVK